MKTFKIKSTSITCLNEENYSLIFEVEPSNDGAVFGFDILKKDLEALEKQRENLSIQHKATLIYCTYDDVNNNNIYFINPLLRSIENINWVDDIPVSGGITTFKSNKFDKPIKIDLKFTYVDNNKRDEFNINEVFLMQFKN